MKVRKSCNTLNFCHLLLEKMETEILKIKTPFFHHIAVIDLLGLIIQYLAKPKSMSEQLRASPPDALNIHNARLIS